MLTPYNIISMDVLYENALVQTHRRQFSSLDKVKEAILNVLENKQYEVESDILQQMVQYYNRASDMIKEVFLFVKDSGQFKAYMSEREFLTKWAEIEQIITNNKVRRNRVGEVKKSI